MLKWLREKLQRRGVPAVASYGWWPVSSSLDAVDVTTEGSLRVAAAYRAVSLISGDMARLGARVEGGAGDLLEGDPSRYHSQYEFRRAMMVNALLYGNAFAVINRTVGGDLLELLPLGLETVSLDLTKAEPVYRTSMYGEVPMSSMLHIRAAGLDGLWGESPVRLCRTSLSVLAAQESAQLEVMKNAGNPKIAFVHPGPMPSSAKQMLLEQYQKDHSGASNAGKPLVLSEGMKVERISSTLDDQGIAAAIRPAKADRDQRREHRDRRERHSRRRSGSWMDEDQGRSIIVAGR